MFDLKILEIDWDEKAKTDTELGVKLVDSVFSMGSDLWEDIVKFLNKHEASQISVLLPVKDYEQPEVEAEFWIYDAKKSEIACEFVFSEEPKNPGLTLFISNPIKSVNSK